MTVSALARRCGLSRTSILYYESRGLLRSPARTRGNYRHYTERDAERVRLIRQYRRMGLGVAEIGAVLDTPGSGAASILERRLAAIDAEIDALREHQRAILRLLRGSRRFRRTQMMTKDKWVSIVRAAGFSDEDMGRWHREFEKAAPQDHQEFLEFLHIDRVEIPKIREWSRTRP